MAIEKHHVKSKLAVAYVIENTPDIKEYLPETRLLFPASFKAMVMKHERVYLKPDGGHKSKGIIRIDQNKDGTYLMRIARSDKQPVTCSTVTQLWSEVHSLTRGIKYVIQQGIESVTRNNRHFDLRCHALRVDGEWIVGGICGRLGSEGNIITTSHEGGTPILIESLFKDYLHFSYEEAKNMLERLHECILRTVKAVSPMYPNHKEFAVDIGIDENKRIWIFEVNIEPLIRGNFKLLPDKTLYQRIRTLREYAK
jgi:hypothetical protein